MDNIIKDFNEDTRKCKSSGKVVEWSDGDKKQFEREMWDKCNSYIHDLME